jgi:hypothetical protein
MENPTGIVEWGVWFGPAGIILGRQLVDIVIASPLIVV